jgi:topoisomerase-4 subunit A
VPLRKTYEATPAPKLVVAVGDCARTCGVFKGSYALAGRVDQIVPVDAFVEKEPVTIICSAKGWIRAAKGHEVDASTLSYREGDSLLQAVRGRSTQQVAFLDSSGRSYSTLAHTLPSARGNGEPLTGRFTLPAGAHFVGAAIADNDARFVVASSFGYGFVTRFENFTSRNKAGKQLINADAAAEILQPAPVTDTSKDWIVSVTSAGHLLAFPISELPELDKGKGNKLIQIPPARLKSGEERVIAVASVRQGGELTLYCGARYITLGWRDLQAYEGARASRGNSLPRGFQRVDSVEAS